MQHFGWEQTALIERRDGVGLGRPEGGADDVFGV